jgi:cystathionine beta-lyase/cystathionine gamma-synthase
MCKSNSTDLAQIGLFPLGNHFTPLTPAVNATTLIVNRYEELSPISNSSLTEGNGDLFIGLYYGGIDTPTTRHLSHKIAKIEKGKYALLAPSGQNAIYLFSATLLKPGDHLLVCDTTTYTTCWLFEQHFRPLGIEIEYFAPQDVGVFSHRLRANTKAVFWESPGSFTFELLDGAAIVAVCRKHDAITIVDNTWAASTFHHPLDDGVDVVVLSLTKSHAAAAGVSLGAIITNHQSFFEKTKLVAALLGSHVSSEDCASAIQSMSTLAARLSHQMATTTQMLHVLQRISTVTRIFHPTLRSENSKIFARDYAGFNSLVSIELDCTAPETIKRLNRLNLIKIGYGWGGTLSLANYFDPSKWASAHRFSLSKSYVRLYFGLEDSRDIEEDLHRAFSS